MDKIDELLSRGVEKIYPSREALEKVLRSGKKLRLYQGFDPSGPLLHIGHLVGLMKMRQFNKLGHHVIFLIGDFTGMIGDPTGKSESRKPLTREEVLKNARFYRKQTEKIFDYAGSNPVEIKYNSEWLSKITAPEFIKLTSYLTYQQIVERNLFQERKKRGLDVNMTEFFYPVLQGYDSVAMDVDLEIGGSDQMFNMMVGRDLMHKIKRREKFVMTTPLLTDSTGKKIGKTEGNVIALTAKPNEFYGMIMSLPDDVIDKCFEYITDLPMEDVERIRKDLKSGKNPMTYKKLLAFTLTKILNSEKDVQKAERYFEETFQKKKLTGEIPIIKIGISENITVIDIMTILKLAKSRSDAKRLITEGAVEIDGVRITNPQQGIKPKNDMIVKVGKHRFAKLSINN